MQKVHNSRQSLNIIIAAGLIIGLTVIPTESAFARGGGGRGGNFSGGGGGARTHVNAGGGNRNFSGNAGANRNFNGNANVNRNVNANANVNRNVNANVNRNVNVNNVNVNRNVHVNGGGYYGGYYNNNGVSTGAAVAIGLTGLAVGAAIASSQVPPSCSIVSVNGISYQQCGSTWLQPQYSGSQVTYVVVNPPR